MLQNQTAVKLPERLCFGWLKSAGKVRLIYPAGLTIICMETTPNPPIIADTSALVSLATMTDQNHARAVAEARKLGTVSIILPSDVLAETINILGKKSGHKTACKAAEQLLHPDSQFVLIETTAYVQAALTKFAHQPEDVSYTDCMVMAVADAYDTRTIFGFDRQFAKAGYERLAPAGGELPDVA
jgi:predicted nucleic acid-binding protein